MGYCGLAVCFGSRPGCFDGIAHMKILVIPGFLGAGKTTFIKELAKRTKQDFAVMENEYGAVGVDGGLLSGTQDDSGAPLNIWELTEGCICCTRKSDFATSVLTIANTIDPEYLVVEPTGVGMLSKIMENIRMIQYERIFLLSPITILDGEHFEQSLEKFPDICRDQIQTAGTILISKREQADEEERRQMEARIRAINPEADVCSVHYSKMDDAWWKNLLKRPLDSGKAAETAEETSDLENMGLTEVSLKNENELILFLQGVVSGVFGDIYRAKGFLKAGKAWLRFDVVDKTYTITGIDPMEESKSVFIGTGLKRNLLREVLQKSLYIKPGAAVPVSRKQGTAKGMIRPGTGIRQRINKE